MNGGRGQCSGEMFGQSPFHGFAGAQHRQLFAYKGENLKAGKGIATLSPFSCAGKEVGKTGTVKADGGLRHIEVQSQLCLAVKRSDIFFRHDLSP